MLATSFGCQQTESAVTFVSYKDPYFPEPFHVDFVGCAYRAEASGDLHVLGRTETVDDDQTFTQYLHLHIYWQPKPGKTFVNSTTTNALIRYVVTTDSGSAVYTGTGFAYPKRDKDGTLEVSIESAYMTLERLTGELPDLFGNTRMTGTLLAEHAEAESLRRQRAMEMAQNR